jgi:hypothetical protein
MILPELYYNCLKDYLSESQLLTLEILVWLLQVHKQVRLERLAACFPLPIMYESRRRHLQRFLLLPSLSIPLVWFPLIKYILRNQIQLGSRVVVPLDRTQWKSNNLLMVSVIWKKRAFPLYWQFLPKAGSSNLHEQLAVIRPVLKLLKGYEIVIIGDREFRSVELASWLKTKKVKFALRQKQDTYIRSSAGDFKLLSQLGLTPGTKLFYTGVTYTKKKGFGTFCLAAYWRRKYRGHVPTEGWYILTNLATIEEVIEVYQLRSGIEALFKDCKSGGYNLEGSKASTKRLTCLVLLIAIAYTCACLQGTKIKRSGIQKYVNRLKEIRRVQQRHSNFWAGMYGLMWIVGMEFCQELVERLMSNRRNKLSCFQRGLRAMLLIQLAA